MEKRKRIDKIPIKVRELIYEMEQGKRKNVLRQFAGKTIVSPTLAVAVIKAELNYDITTKAISSAKMRYNKQENIEGQNGKGKAKWWGPLETKRCKELILKIPDRSSREDWQKIILDPLDKEFPERIHTQPSVQNRMTREGVKRTNTYAIGGDQKPAGYFEARWLEGGWELISHEEGTQVWIVKCLICGRETKKTKVLSYGCRYCTEDANLLGTLYLIFALLIAFVVMS